MRKEFLVKQLAAHLAGVITNVANRPSWYDSNWDRQIYADRISDAIVSGLMDGVGKTTSCGPDFSDEQCCISGEVAGIIKAILADAGNGPDCGQDHGDRCVTLHCVRHGIR